MNIVPEPSNLSQGHSVVDPAAAVSIDHQQFALPPTPLQYLSSESETSLADAERKRLGKLPATKIKSAVSSNSEGDGSGEDSIQTATVGEAKGKKWYKRLNPLKRSKKPPVPKERTVSREYGASFFSLLTFHWMAPLMTVRNVQLYSS
jgi:ATP-binding cassette subfamily C (CFTR/MRP) protein 1